MLVRGFLVGGAMMLASGVVSAQTCDVTVEGNDAMAFNAKELKVDSGCSEINVTLKHVGKLPVSAMGHNVVITKTADYKDVAKAGGKATLEDAYVPKDDARVLAHTKVIGGGETTSVKIPGDVLKAGEDYTFFCSFPGHWSVMKGKFVVGG
ncbi:MAG: azurin [Lautropia sp.]|nr:azurin [Lautropia sp.]